MLIIPAWSGRYKPWLEMESGTARKRIVELADSERVRYSLAQVIVKGHAVCKHSANARGDSGRHLAPLCGIQPVLLTLVTALSGTLRHSTMKLAPPLHGGGHGWRS